jgi:DNA-binding transcriptional ArsR family regulator
LAASPALDMIQQPHRAAALLHPLRFRILQALREPGSATSVAQRLDLPRQRVNYHLRQLEKDGLVQFIEERRKGNCVERILRATASHFLITPEVLGDLAANPDAIQDRFSSTYLVAVAARAIHELAALRAGADAAGKRLATLTLQSDIAFASPSARNAFADELAAAVARLAAKYHEPGAEDARRFKLLVGVYPQPQPQEPA